VNCYKCERYLYRALRSIALQDMKEKSVLLVLNKSYDWDTSHTEEICALFKDRLEIVIERTPQFMALGRAKAFGLSRCSGQFIAFLDADDEFLSTNKLREQVNFMEANELDLSFT